MVFRRATLTDIDELVECRLEMRLERETNKMAVDAKDMRSNNYDYFKQHLSDGSFISWVALDNGKIAATSGLCFYNAPPTFSNPSGVTAYIMNMYTKPGYRKKGIATKLMEYIIQEVKSRECSKITLHASDIGRQIYEKLGFKDIQGYMELHI